MNENTNLPPMTTRIVGRRATIELIQKDVSNARLVSIVGAGGIGKTTVALAIAEEAVESYADGVWLVDFAPLKEASLVPNAIATALGLIVHSANVMPALCRFLRDRETFLVLDNCEHMIQAIAPCVTRILDEAPGVRILTTSRAPLRVAGEQVQRLPGLGLPPASADLTAADALTFPAIELFVERASDRSEAFQLTDADSGAVADICRNLDGIALAIELAAMRIDVFGVRGLQKQLDDRFRLLGGRRAGLERHRTLAATLDWSYSLLPSREAALLCAVSVFAGVFCLRDAAAISSLDPSDVGAMLTELAAQSLLSAETEAETGEVIYRPLETTRAYCLEKLIANGEDAAIRARHAEYICRIVESAVTERQQRPPLEWAAAYGRYLDDLRAALAWAGANRDRRSLLIRLTAAGTVLWNHFSLTDESRVHLARAVAELRDTEAAGTAAEMNLQVALAGATIYTRGIVREAKVAVERALEIAIARNDTECHLACLRILGTYQLFSGQNANGIRTLQTFVTMAAAQDPSALAEGESHLGCGELFIGRLPEARRRLERLHAQGLQDLNAGTALRFQYLHSISTMIVLSHAQWLTNSPAAAERTAAMVIEYALAAGHELSLCIGLAWTALVYLWSGRDEDCRRHSTMLDDLTQRHGIVTWRPVATFCLGALASRHDESRAQGVAALEQMVAECKEIGHIARLPYFMSTLAEALARHGRLADAERVIREALAMATEHEDNWSLAELVRVQATILAAQGKHEEQEAMLLKSMALADEFGTTSWRLRAGIDLAKCWHAQSRSGEAREMLQPVFDSFSEGFETRDLVDAARILAELRDPAPTA